MTEAEIREAPRELLALAVAMRPDWDRDATWNGLLAAHAAGWTPTRMLREVTRLVLIGDSTPTDLRLVAGDIRIAQHGSLPDDLRARVIADMEAPTTRQRQEVRDAQDGAA
jgi:hypothetical protein